MLHLFKKLGFTPKSPVPHLLSEAESKNLLFEISGERVGNHEIRVPSTRTFFRPEKEKFIAPTRFFHPRSSRKSR